MLFKKLLSKDLKTYSLFSIDSKLVRPLTIFAFCCQIISGFSEWLGIAPFLIDLLLPFFSVTSANTIGNVMAVSLALFLEFLVFYLVGFVIHAIKQKYWQEGTGIDKVFNKIKFWSATGLLAILIFVSMFLSKRNVKYQIAATTIEVEQIDLDQFDTKKAAQIAAIENRYLADKNDLDNSLADSKQLVQNAYTAKISAIQEQINILVRKEQRTGNSYISKRTFHKKEIATLRTAQADELHQLRKKYDGELATLKHNRSNDIYAISDKLNVRQDKAEKANDKTAGATEIRNNWISWVLQIIASCAVLGFVVARSWVEMATATAGITEKVEFTNDINSNFFKELFLLVRLKVQRKLQNKIRKGLGNIEGLEELRLANTNLPYAIPNDSKEPYFSTPTIDRLNRLFNSDSNEIDLYDFKDFSKNKKDVEPITATVEIDTTFSEDSKQCVHSVLDDFSSDAKNDINPTVISGQIVGEKNCKNCGEVFHYRNKKKTYCSTLCRQQFWEKTNGKKLKRGRASNKE